MRHIVKDCDRVYNALKVLKFVVLINRSDIWQLCWGLHEDFQKYLEISKLQRKLLKSLRVKIGGNI